MRLLPHRNNSILHSRDKGQVPGTAMHSLHGFTIFGTQLAREAIKLNGKAGDDAGKALSDGLLL
jgi:hypothetical protein